MRNIDLLSLLDAEPGAPFLQGFQPLAVPKGYLISTPQDPKDQVLIVRSGRVRVYVANDDKELTLAFLEAGDIFSTHTPAFLRTLKPSRLLLMESRRFGQSLAAEPGMAPLIMRVLGRLLANSIALVEDLAFRDVASRLARYLLSAAKQRGLPCEEGIRLPLDLSTGDIALLLGTTRQSVSTLLNRMEREGLLERQGRHCLLLRQPEALAGWQSSLSAGRQS